MTPEYVPEDDGLLPLLPPPPPKGRGAVLNPPNRFVPLAIEPDPDEGPLPAVQTQYFRDGTRSIITTNQSPDVGILASINPYRGCEHGCVYCLHGDTAILMGDGSQRALADLKVGDEIYGTEMVGFHRRCVKSLVLKHWTTVKPAYRIILENGTTLIASGNHRLLTEHGWKHVSSRVCRLERNLSIRDQLMGLAEVTPTESFPSGKRSGGIALMQETMVGKGVSSSTELRVAAIEPLGRDQPLFDITTSTGDFIANGVVSHNCYARPTHEYLGLSAGIDFETKIWVKENAPELLAKELSSPKWRPKPLALSGITDPYQPVEKRLGLTRRILEVLVAFRNPVAIITKNHLVTRDADLLAELAKLQAAIVYVSITTLDDELRNRLEPRTSSPSRRLDALRMLTDRGIPTGVMMAPVIPGITDSEIPAVLKAAAEAGALGAGYTMLRLPYQVAPLFEAWLETHYPERKDKVLNRIRAIRGGKLNDPRFGSRMRGEGFYADEIAALFRLSTRRAGLGKRRTELSTEHFRVPGAGPQGELFQRQ
jgi:DNA repair photolyase